MVVQKSDVGKRVRFRDKGGAMREGVLIQVKPGRFAVIRYEVPGGAGETAAVLSLEGEGADDRVAVIL